MATTTQDLITSLQENRTAKFEEARALLDLSQMEKRDLTEDEEKSWRASMDELEKFDERINDLSKQHERERLAEEAGAKFEAAKPIGGSGVRVGKEPLTYERHAPRSYFRDLAMVTANRDMDGSIRERLVRHAAEMEIEQRAVSRTDTTSAGEFIPPLWLIDEYGQGLRAGRVAANLCTELDLPGGTDSINIPTLNGGTTQLSLTGVQTADNTALASQDIISNTVTAGVKTIGGFEDVALQVLEQSPLAGGMDQLIFSDLAQDYAKRLDLQVLNGSGASGQALGILGTTGINSVTYTQASPTVVTHYPVVSQLVSNIAKNRFLGPNAILMHPSRWYWFTAALDSQNRPLVVPNQNMPFNAMGINDAGDYAEGGTASGVGPLTGMQPLGWIQGLPVYADANIPLNLGGGVNEDRIIVGRFSDALLFEGPIRVSAHPDILANSMGMRLRLYRYFAFTAARYPVSFSTATGTGNIVTTVLAGF